jgi:hypothetical protein
MMRARRAGKVTPRALRARLSDHDMAIAVALPERGPASAIAAMVPGRGPALAIAAMVPERGPALAIAAMDRGSVIVAAGALVVVDADRVDVRSARFVSIT